MKLNPDCIRAFLMTIEDITDGKTELGLPWQLFSDIESSPFLEGFTLEEIEYHARQCDHHGYFIGCNIPDDASRIYLVDLSPKAHEFLANVRDRKNWEKTKMVAGSVKSFSLKALQKIASSIIEAAIKSHFENT